MNILWKLPVRVQNTLLLLLRQQRSLHLKLAILTLGVASILLDSNVQAQIVPDTTLGRENSLVTPNVTIKGLPSERIDGGAVRGTNLFHSFKEFNIDAGRGAYFTNPIGVERILSRVTGGNLSNIRGTLGVLGNAKLFLVNPSGIIFGPAASLDVSGSFLASTASSLNFADGAKFSSQHSQQTPLLTITAPIGLSFGSNPGNILVQGNGGGTRLTSTLIDTTFGLRVPPERGLALLGGNVFIEGGTVKSPGGRIELGSVIGPGTVGIISPDTEDFSFDYTNVAALGEIRLTRQAAVDASGLGGGNIQVQARRLLLAEGSQIEASTLGEKSGGTLTINTSDAVELTGTSIAGRFITPSGISAFVYPRATGAGDNLNINTRRLIVKEGGTISTATLGIGAGGTLSIKADDLVEVTGTLIAAGQRGGGIATSVAPRAVGSAGDLNIETRRLVIRNGGLVSTTSLGLGAPGDLFIKAREFVVLTGGADEETPSSLSARSRGAADGGNITVKTQQLSVVDGAQVSTSSSGTGSAGNITLTTRSLQLSSGFIEAETQSGNGGDINLQVENLLLLRHNSHISTDTGTAQAGGNGGNININTEALTALENSDITANAQGGTGGRVIINAQGLFLSPDSDITATSEAGSQFGGVVQINTQDIDPSRALADLPTELVNVTELIAQSCPGTRGNVGTGASEFIATGRGGLPPSQPGEPLRAEVLINDENRLEVGGENRSSEVAIPPPTRSTPPELVEAQGWLFNNKGEVVLTAYPTSTTPYSPESSSSTSTITCYAP